MSSTISHLTKAGKWVETILLFVAFTHSIQSAAGQNNDVPQSSESQFTIKHYWVLDFLRNDKPENHLLDEFVRSEYLKDPRSFRLQALPTPGAEETFYYFMRFDVYHMTSFDQTRVYDLVACSMADWLICFFHFDSTLKAQSYLGEYRVDARLVSGPRSFRMNGHHFGKYTMRHTGSGMNSEREVYFALTPSGLEHMLEIELSGFSTLAKADGKCVDKLTEATVEHGDFNKDGFTDVGVRSKERINVLKDCNNSTDPLKTEVHESSSVFLWDDRSRLFTKK